MHISSSLQPSCVNPIVVDGVEWQFAIIVKVDTHIKKLDLLMVYTNDLVVVENSINTMEWLLAKDDKYKVVGFDLKYTCYHVGYDQKIVVAQLCMGHRMLVFHYFLATRPCERFTRFANNPDDRFEVVIQPPFYFECC
ncbi:hypothetical protein D1007_42542 [Hordeum vulgare]|nr:hypothetical protein D1007_42542 [Hordeum vulgare]